VADYNLGTAHGRIVIDFDDSSSKEAESAFQAVASKASWLHGQLKSVGQGVRDFASDFGNNMNHVGRSVVAVAGVASVLTVISGGFHALGTSLTGLRGGIGALSTLIFGMRGLPESAQGFPRIIRQIILLSAGLTALRAGTSILARLAGRFALLAPFAGVIRGLGESLFRLGAPVRAIAGVALAIAGLITGVRVSTALAKAVLGLTAAFGGLYGVISIINGIIGAITQLSGALGLIPGAIFAAVAGAATLATGFSGLSKALKFVAPASGGASKGMDQMAKAAKSAARSIASAQKAVTDAVRDQARTFRDTGRQIADAQQAVKDAVISAAEANENAAKRVVRAQRDLSDAIKDAGKSAADNARRVADAQDAVLKATENGTRSVASASRTLQSAIKSENKAQLSLNDARETALQQMKDSVKLVNDLALDQEGAAIGLIEAQKNLNKVNDDALSTDLDKRKALYELNVAQSRVNDTTEAQSKALEAAAKAQKDGVDGAQVVIDAQEALKDAQQSVTDAQDDFARAQKDANEANIAAARDLADAVAQSAEDRIASERKVQDATEDLLDAQKEQTKTAAAGARDIADAQKSLALAEESAAEAREAAAERVTEAYQRLAEAQEDAAESLKQAASAAAGAEDPINKLSPAAQALVKVIRGLKPAWDDLRKSVQEKLFTGIADEVQSLATTYFPLLKKGMGDVADSFNNGLKAVSAFFKETQTQDDIAYGFQLTKKVVDDLVKGIKPLLEAFRDIGIVGLEVFASLTGGVGTAAEQFRDFIREARESGKLRDWIMNGVKGFQELWGIIKDVATSLKLVFQGITGSDGSDFLSTLAGAAKSMRDFLESAKGQEGLKQLGDFLRTMADRTLKILGIAFDQLWPIIQAGKPLFEDLSRVMTEVFGAALGIIGPMVKGLLDFLSFISPVISPILGALFGLGLAWSTLGIAIKILIPLFGLLASAFSFIGTAWRLLSALFMANPWVLLIAAIIALVIIIVTNWDTIKTYIADALVWIGDRLKEFGGWLYGIFVQPFIDAGNEISSWWTNFTGGFSGGLDDFTNNVKTVWNGTWDAVGGFFKDRFTDLKDFSAWAMGGLLDDQTGQLKSIGQIWDESTQMVKDGVKAALDWVLSFFGTNTDAIVADVRTGLDMVGNFFRNLGPNIAGFISNLPTILRNAGVDAIVGLWNGISGMGGWLYDRMWDFIRAYVPGPVKDFLGIASPSKYFEKEIGKMIPLGLIGGITSMNSQVANAATSMANVAGTAAASALAAQQLGMSMPDSLTGGGMIADAAAAAALSRTNAAAASAIPASPQTGGTDGTTDGYDTAIQNLNLYVTGNLDPTNKLAWDQAMDQIRDGIRDRERVRK
jgi:phage-related protein